MLDFAENSILARTLHLTSSKFASHAPTSYGIPVQGTDTDEGGNIMDSLELNINGQTIVLVPKTFSTGSKGYHGAGKVFILIEAGSKPTAEDTARAKSTAKEAKK